ncbi:MAG: DNA polymerase III subunit alpha [Candidatus Pacebacteria bacterium]|nr:DNA polymerase III subunit alpha [Candidatus Paceibacterota bacterium]
MSQFVHLHNHSHYSLLQGLSKIPDMMAKAKEYNMKALAITDYGSMYGCIEFYKQCLKNDIKPIIGLDAYMAFRSMEQKDHGIDNKRYPFTLLAYNLTGYKNLMKLVTQSYIKGFYYRPRMDKDLLQQHSEGLICMSGPIFGEVGQAVITKQMEKAENIIKEYQDIFGKENFYLEIMFNNHIDGLPEINKDIAKLSKKTGAPLVATNNNHYISPDDREAFDTLLGVSTTGNKIGSGFMRGDFHFASVNEMIEKFADYPEAIENTVKIADRCDIEIDIDSWYFPDIEIPEGTNYDDYLRKVTYEGIAKRGMERTAEVEERIEYELGIIQSKGYSSYFLIMADLVRAAKDMGIYTNTRGSAAGSLVSYLNFVTKVDPLEMGLPFERFMNPGRKGIPDVDLDISDIYRDDLIDYARQKYGNKAVAQIGTFGTMAARGSVRDVARALDYPYEMGDKIAKLIPLGAQGFPMTIERAMNEEKDLADLYKNDSDVKRIIDLAQKIEGCARHISVHAAGVVISPTRVDDFCPVQMDPKGGKIITQYDMYTGDRDGVVNMPKFDLLGIRNLTILANAVQLVKDIRDVDIDLNTIHLDDPKTYELLAEGSTMGVFQMASSGMTKYIMELKPSNIYEISAMIALYRPGPLEFIPDYISRKKNPDLVEYLDPRMKEILEPTYGIMVYQEDVMQIAVDLAGYDWGMADKLRKAIGKKIPEMMAEQKEKLVGGCIERGMDKKVAKEMWRQIEVFAAYAFNKSHAASYGRITYETAYMKANYSVEYMTAMLTAESGDTDKIAAIIHECEKMNIKVLPPDINECFGGFTVVDDPENSEQKAIRFGFYTIKNFGEAIADAIIEERKRAGKFTSLEGLLNRIRHRNFNKKSLEALIMAGALDGFGERGQLLYNLESLLEYNKGQKTMHADQGSLFGETSSHITLRPAEPMNEDQRLMIEKEVLGVYVSGHPLDPFKVRFEKSNYNISMIHSGDVKNEQKIIIGGIIDTVKEITTKKGQKMAFITISDFTGSVEAVVFPKTYEKNKSIIVPDTVIATQSVVSDRDGEKSVIINGIKKLEK